MIRPKLKIKTGLFLRLTLLAGFFIALSVSAADTSPDAIGLRVMPNANNISPLAWYKANIRQQGSPQSLIVDGYEAIRDGRTVYVSAANLDQASNTFFTNIYIISYNQQAETPTTDIFGQILEHWKFNTNLTEPGTCSQASTTACLASSDCPSGQYCLSLKAKVIRDTKRLADLNDMKVALAGYRQQGYYPKLSAGSYLANQSLSVWPSWQQTLAKELKVVLPYDPVNRLGSCPGYDDTTCWNQQDKKFAGSIPNNLPANSRVYAYTAAADGSSYGLCAYMESGYLSLDQGACTAASGNASSGVINRNAPAFLDANLPQTLSGSGYSSAFIKADRSGLIWSIDRQTGCDQWSNLRLVAVRNFPAQKEVKADKAGVAGNCVFTVTIKDGANTISKDFTIKTANKNLPVISPVSDQTIIVGKDNLDLTISASEADGQYPLTFSSVADQLPPGLVGQISGNTNYHISGIADLPISDYRDYRVTLTAYDSYQGAGAPASFVIKVTNNPPAVNGGNAVTKSLPIGYNLNFTIPAADSDGATHYPLIFDLSGDLSQSVAVSTADNGHDAEILSGALISQTGDYHLALKATDAYSAVSPAIDLKITLTNQPPVIPDQVLPQATGCHDYSYQIQASDPDNHGLKYTITGLPAGLSANQSGLITGQPLVPAGDFTIQVDVQDMYYDYTEPRSNAQASKTLTLKVVDEQYTANLSDQTTYPNPEDRAIYPYHDGQYYWPNKFFGQGGVTTATAVTYSLINNPNWLSIGARTGEILNGSPTNNDTDPGVYDITLKTVTDNCQVQATKVFTIKVKKNSWCGDGVCGSSQGETCDSCTVDCGTCCTPNCAGKSCGPDGCGGVCGTCSSEYNCTSGTCCPVQAGIQVCADNQHTTYFNGAFVSQAADWSSVQQFNVSTQSGKNVIAVTAADWGGIWGFSATLNRGSCSNMNTNDVSGWKCTNYPYGNWNQINYDDSSWPTAIVTGSPGVRNGNYLTYQQIWASNANYAGSTVYCRYTFYVEN